MRCLKYFLIGLIVALAFIGVGINQQIYAQADISPEQSAEEQELKKAQIEYYRSQTEKLRNKSLYESLIDNPAGLMTALGAFIAALIALTSLVVNRRVTIRNQKDTQFYEALKRFGDKDSPMLRSSAAGLLAQMGREKSPVLRKKLYFKTATDQLGTALLLEKDHVVLASVFDGIANLSSLNRKLVAEKLWAITRSVRVDLEQKIIEWALDRNITTSEGFIEEHVTQLSLISEVAASTVRLWFRQAQDMDTDSKKTEFLKRYDEHSKRLAARSEALEKVSRGSITREIVEISNRVEMVNLIVIRVLTRDRASRSHRALRKITGWSWLQKVDFPGAWLPNAGLRWTSTLVNLDLRSSTMQRADFQYAELTNVNLRFADLRDAKMLETTLHRVDLRYADLRGTDLRWARLWKVKLSDAQIDENTDFRYCNWWAANFYFFARDSVDEVLLKKLLAKYPDALTAISRSAVHPSVRYFLKKAESSSSSD